MPETYSRVGSLMIRKESTANTPLTPNVSIPFNDEDISNGYDPTPATPVQGNRAMNLRAILNKIPAASGSINMNVEPKSFGYMLEGIGDLTSGVLFQLSDVDDLSVGDTIDNGSTGTGTVAAIIEEQLMVLVTGVSGDWATGNTVDNGASHSSTLGTFSATVYGHMVRLPKSIDNTFTVQRNYSDRAIRWCGARFHAIDGFAQSDNVITASVKMIAQSVFTHARVTGTVTSGAGSKTIPLDQTQGLVASDSIKVWRPGTGFLDFSASAVKTHTIGSINAGASIVVTNLQTSLQADDILLLAPITPSYSLDEEFPWVGGSQMSIGALTSSLSAIDVQDYTMVLSNDMEERHSATGTLISDRMATAILQKGFTASGSFTMHNEDESYRRLQRLNTERSIRFATTGNQISTTGIYYQLIVTYSEIQITQYDMVLGQDDIVNEEVPFDSYYSDTDGWSVQLLLINDVASY